MPLSDRDQRTLKIGGVVAGVLVLAILLMKLLSGGGEEAAPPLVPSVPGSTTSPSGSPSTTVTPSPVLNPVGRDPFSIPAYFGFTNTTTTTSTTTPTATTTTTTPTSTATSTPTQTPTGSNPSRATLGGHEVVLLDTFARHGVDMAQVEVDANVYTVAEGSPFAQGQFELRSVSGNFATILFGDESVTLRALHPK
jgi:hypothetical protein